MAAKKITLDDLAAMVQQGFLELKDDVQAGREETRALRAENSRDHADLRFKLSETVSRVEHNQLTRRVEALESQRR